MPFLIGPGSVSAATMAGLKLTPIPAIGAVALALLLTSTSLIVLKIVFDAVRTRNAALTQRYVEIASRVSAMVVGSIAVEMLFSGLEAWRADLR
jgi:small neutral amino acid transporter SnatA (MarC family)